MTGAFRREERGSIPGEGQPTSNARLAAELQAVALGIRMFGLEGFSNMYVGAVPITAPLTSFPPLEQNDVTDVASLASHSTTTAPQQALAGYEADAIGEVNQGKLNG